MAEGIDPLELKIVVNKDTGALEVFGAELKQVKKAGEQTQGAMGQLGKEFGHLLGPLAALATVHGVYEFFKEGAIAAEQQAESMRRLSFTLQMNGVDFAANEEKIKSWAEEVQKTTRFSDDQYLSAFERAAKVTKDVAQAHEIVRVAMGMSVKAGGTLEERIGQVTSLMTGNQRAVLGLSREMGTLINATDSASTATQKLQDRFSGAAEEEDNRTSRFKQLVHQIDDLKKKAGGFAVDAIEGWAMYFDFIAKGWKSIITVAVTGVAALTTILHPFAKKGAGATAKAELEAGLSELRKIWTDHHKKLSEEHAKGPKLKVGTGKKDTEELKKDLADQLQLLQAGEAMQLSTKNLSEASKLAIVRNSERAQLALLNANSKAYAGRERELAGVRQKIHLDTAKKIKDIEQKNVQERVAVQEAWVAKNRQMGAAVGDAGRKAADTLASSYANAFAKMAMEGKYSEEALKAASIQIAEQVIADMIRIGIQKGIADAIAATGIGLQTKEMIALGAATDKTLASAIALNIALV